MAKIIERGRVAIKLKGRNASLKLVIVSDKPEKNIVEVIYENGKKDKTNIMHIFPLNEKIDFKNEEEAIKALRQIKF